MDKRFKLHIKWSNLTKTEGIAELSDNGQPLLKTECIEDARLLQTILNELHEENEQLKDALNQRTDQCDKYYKENEQLKQEDELFFGKVFDILLKYQDLFNREMADEVLEELGIELTKWFE